MGGSQEERLTEILARCMAELFAEQGIRAERVATSPDPPEMNESLAAFSGFGCAELRGSITLLASRRLFSRLHPLPIDVVPRDLADWASELVNQSVGRYRNRLLAHDVSLTIGTPQSALAADIVLQSRLRNSRKPLCFAIENDVLEVWLDLEVNSELELVDTSEEERTVAVKEGSALFF